MNCLEALFEDERSFLLWKEIVDSRGKTFCTSGRGEVKGVEFSYSVKEQTSSFGKHYKGLSVRGFSNEIKITGTNRTGKQKTITRSSFDIALDKVINLNGIVTGPKQLGVYGASYIYAIFIKLGIIHTVSKNKDNI